MYNSSISICPMLFTVVRKWFCRLYVCSEAEECIDQPVVPDDGQKSLFVIERVCANQFRCRVGDGNCDHILAGPDADRRNQSEAIT